MLLPYCFTPSWSGVLAVLLLCSVQGFYNSERENHLEISCLLSLRLFHGDTQSFHGEAQRFFVFSVNLCAYSVVSVFQIIRAEQLHLLYFMG